MGICSHEILKKNGYKVNAGLGHGLYGGMICGGYERKEVWGIKVGTKEGRIGTEWGFFFTYAYLYISL